MVVPELMPSTLPVPGSTVPIAVLLLLQLPPVVISLSNVVAPAHTDVTPVIAGGASRELTVTTVVA